MSVMNLVSSIEEDIVCTNSTQLQVEELIFSVDTIINQVQADLETVHNTKCLANLLILCVRATYNGLMVYIG